jgi:hypothetical protein
MKLKEFFRKKPFRLIFTVSIILILLVILLVPALVSSSRGRNLIMARIGAAAKGKASCDALSMGWLKGIRLEDFRFNDNAGQIAASAKQFSAKPHYLSLLVGAVSVDLAVNDGNVKIIGPKTQTVELSQINSQVSLRPPGSKTVFDINMVVADKTESRVAAEGSISPGAGWSLRGASGILDIDVNDLDLASLKPIFTLAGIDVQANGRISAVLKGELENGRIKNLDADVKGKNLDVTAPQLKGDRFKTDVLDVKINMKDSNGLMNIDRFNIHADWADVNAAGVIPTTLVSLLDFTKAGSPYNLKGAFDCNLAAVLSQMPHTLGLKETVKMTAGRLSGDIDTYTAEGRKGIRTHSSLIGLEGIVDGKKIVLSEPLTADAQISSDSNGLKFDKLDVTSSFAKINCFGDTRLLNCSADADLAKFQAELGQFLNTGPYKLAGLAAVKAKLAFTENKITAVGSSAVKDLRLTSADGSTAYEPAADLNFDTALDRKENLLGVNSFRLTASFGQITANSASLPLVSDAAKPLSLPLSAHLDLQKIQPFAVLLASFPKEMQLAGVLDSNLSLSAEKNNYRIVTDATKITNLKISYPQQQPFEQAEVLLSADITFNPIDKTYTGKLQLTSPQIKIKGNINQTVSGGNAKLDGEANCEYDWAALSTIAAPYLPKGLTLKGQRKDNISFTSRYPANQPDKLLDNLTTAAKLGFQSAEYMGLNLGPTEVDIQVGNGLLKIAPFSTTLNNGRLNFAGQADFRAIPKVFKTPGPLQIAKNIQIDDKTTKKLLMYLNPIFADAVNVTGTANFNCDKLVIPLTGSGIDAELIGTVSIDQLRLQGSGLIGQILSFTGAGSQGQNITIHPTRFVLQKGFLQYDNMQMDIGSNPINFSGTIGLDKSLKMTITLPYTLQGRAVRTGQESAGQRISLAIKGSVDKPQLDVGKLLEQQAVEKGMELLEGLMRKK